MKGRKLPRTPTIVQQENAALKNKVKCLNDALEEAYANIRKLTNENHQMTNIIKETIKIADE